MPTIIFVYLYTWWYMTLGRCPLSIFCFRGSCPCECDERKSVEPTNPESITPRQFWADWFYSRLTPIEWIRLPPSPALLPSPAPPRLKIVYASSHTWSS